MNSTADKANRLIRAIAKHRRVIVALSGGVDSSVVAAAAKRASLDDLVAVTADSPSVARWQLEMAQKVASEIGVVHLVVNTDEGSDEQYVRNDSRRCFFCKQTLYRALRSIVKHAPEGVIVSGTNADDLGDYRPGIQAGDLAGVLTPLADLGFSKADVREIAHYFDLSNAELAASPCLASRIAYGVPVTPERLSRVEHAEAFLREMGFGDLRVRLHENELARIEVHPDEISRFSDPSCIQAVEQQFRSVGFRYVTVDLQGLRSGSMNEPLVTISGVSK